MASTSGDLAATGSVRLNKNPVENLAIIQIAGTYGSLSFVVEGTIATDPTSASADWFALAAQRLDTQAVVTGAISPTDNAEQAWRANAHGLTGIRARVTAVSSGTATFTLQTFNLADVIPALGNVLSGGTLSGVTLSGTTTISGPTTQTSDRQDQFVAGSADGAVSIKSGVVYITKAGVCALTIADPTATVDDGKTLIVFATTAHAHTLSNAAGSGFNGAGSGSDVGTFGGAIGDMIEISAYQGKWYVMRNTNVTLG